MSVPASAGTRIDPMPAPTSATEFIDLVRRSQLLPETKLDEVMDRHRIASTLPTNHRPARQPLGPRGSAHILSGQATEARTIQAFHYRLEIPIAGTHWRRGMGAVYLCEHTLMRRLVALKVLPVEKLADPVQRGPVLSRGPCGRGTRSPQYRPSLRYRPVREAPLSRHGVRRWNESAGSGSAVYS